MGRSVTIPRRRALKLAAAATALPLVHIRTAGAAGKLNAGFWDHWVPGANDIMTKQINAWADKNKVEVTADFITTTGTKLQLTPAAETQAKTGHDIMTFISWDVQNYADSLDPVDDQMKQLQAANGDVNKIATYLANNKGHWVAIPASNGTQTKPPCARISWFKEQGLDLQAMYPTHDEHNALQDAWTWENFLKYAEAAQKGGMTFSMGMGGGGNTDGTDLHGALFSAFGGALIDAEGKSQLKSDGTRQAMEFAQRLVKFYPADAVSYDDASNNRALISGKSALIFNPPSAWAVAKRDAPKVAADCWTFPAPAGPKGRFVPTQQYFWGVYNFSQNKSAAKDLLVYLMQRENIEAREIACDGYDLPPYAKLTDFKVWETVAPPVGTVYNYPLRQASGQIPSLTASEASPDVAVQIYNRAVHNQIMARLKEGQTIPQVISWAEDEISGFTR
ncbi:MAG TPA: ABC transporter substrate-binding protein [Rhodopila sp.]|uniref:ABC transporter substrate-binding protein n=1 Tax=Rhodopila sp. TaxID=2480087 RepID=UPI002B8F995E|nr:ABC transporter substrate-binding protein [Rhodopila sp.]HVY15533.1 ABC transporter substrate-binding protein [Rhodopila sp.]